MTKYLELGLYVECIYLLNFQKIYFEAETPTKMKSDLVDVSTDIKNIHPETLTVSVENHITLSGVSSMDNGLVNTFNSEKLNLKTEMIYKPVEEGLPSRQDTCLSTMDKATTDHLKHTIKRENENAVLEKMQPFTQNCCDDSYGKYQRLPLPEQTHSEDATCSYLPQLQLHSYNIHFLPSLMTQHRNSVLPLAANSTDESFNTNIETVQVRLFFYSPYQVP